MSSPPDATSADPPLLEARDLVKAYGPVTVVHGVSLSVRRGETLGLVGESGSGKSTVARMMLRLIEPSGGIVTYREAVADGAPRDIDLLTLKARDMRRLRRKLAIVFQDPYAALD